MSRTLLVVSSVLLVFSSLLSVPNVNAQGGDQVGDETEFILYIHGQPDPQDVFTLSVDYCRGDFCPAVASQPRAICGSKERYLEVNSYGGGTFENYSGNCQDGGIYTIAEEPKEGTTINRYTISRRYLNEAGESKEDILSSGSPLVNGGIYFTTYRYPTENAPPTPPVSPPMPEAPPEVGDARTLGRRRWFVQRLSTLRLRDGGGRQLSEPQVLAATGVRIRLIGATPLSLVLVGRRYTRRFWRSGRPDRLVLNPALFPRLPLHLHSHHSACMIVSDTALYATVRLDSISSFRRR